MRKERGTSSMRRKSRQETLRVGLVSRFAVEGSGWAMVVGMCVLCYRSIAEGDFMARVLLNVLKIARIEEGAGGV